MKEEEEQEQGERGHTSSSKDETTTRMREQHPPPLEYTHGDTSYDNDDAYAIPFEHCDEPDDGAVRAEPNHDTIEPLACELVVPEDTGVDWAEDIDEDTGFSIQGEYIPANYPPAPPPAPWYPPHPPTSDYTHPRTCYTPPRTWYNPPPHA